MKQDQRGVLLLIGLVMTMVLLVASAILATIVIREAKVSGLVDRGITALYGSETSTESAIYQIFKLGVDPVTLDGTSGASPSGGSWSRVAKDSTQDFVFDFIVPGSTKELVIFNRDNPGQVSNVSGLSLSWTSGASIDFTTATWDGATLNPGPGGSVSGGTGTINLSGGVHQVVLSSSDVITDLTVATIPGGTLVSIPVTVTVLGEYFGSEQAVELTLPVPAPWNAAPAVCGNSTIETGEQCDDGNTTPGDGCDAACQLEGGAICGNSIVEATEQCDDGNTSNGDGCDSACQFESATCGNGAVEPPEVCDDGDAGNTGTCNATCTALTVCGDGVIQTPNGNPGTGEQCDDGNTTPGDGCDATCQNETGPVCGNSVTEPPENCDDGNATNFGTCNSSCSGPTFCGDGTTQNPNGFSQAEQCDDGGNQSEDGCSATCQTETVASSTLFNAGPTVRAIDVHSNGHIYVVGTAPGKIFDEAGNEIAPIVGATGVDGIAVAPGGEYYLSIGATIDRRSAAGGLLGTFPTAGSGKLDYNPSNNQIIVAESNGRVTAYNTSGAQQWQRTGFTNITDIEVRTVDILITQNTGVASPGSALIRLSHSGGDLFMGPGFSFSKAVASHTSSKFWIASSSNVQLFTAIGNPSIGGPGGYSNIIDLANNNVNSFIYGYDAGSGDIFRFDVQ